LGVPCFQYIICIRPIIGSVKPSGIKPPDIAAKIPPGAPAPTIVAIIIALINGKKLMKLVLISNICITPNARTVPAIILPGRENCEEITVVEFATLRLIPALLKLST